MKTILIALAALAFAAPAAHAATIGYAPDGALLVTAAPGERNHLGIQAAADDSGRVVIYEGTPGVPLSAPADRCESDDAGRAAIGAPPPASASTSATATTGATSPTTSRRTRVSRSPAAPAAIACRPRATASRRRSTAAPATTSSTAVPAPTP